MSQLFDADAAVTVPNVVVELLHGTNHAFLDSYRSDLLKYLVVVAKELDVVA